MRRSEIVAEARTWLGTPFHHAARVRGHGVDCYGVIEMVARAFNVSVPQNISYSRIPDEAQLTALLDAHAVRVPLNEAQAGDIVVIPFLNRMRHLGFLTDLGILHAYEPVGKVVEHALDAKWRRLIRRAYSMPGVENG